ncbi:MAG: glycoside hydrolase family 20 zincin-like fold domain-containing protein, partial [Candidatus Cybelea sp.]
MHLGLLAAAGLAASLHLVPHPQSVDLLSCPGQVSAIPRTVPVGFDAGARAEVDERWGALRIGRLRTASGLDPAITVRHDGSLPAQAYRLTVRGGRASIESADEAGAFYAAMTLAQLPVHSSEGWSIPCVRIEDRPALRWRILSDDVSRGPLPT